MIIQVSIEDKDVVLQDSVSGVVKFSSDLPAKDFTSAINKLEFAHGLKRWTEKYYNYLRKAGK